MLSDGNSAPILSCRYIPSQEFRAALRKGRERAKPTHARQDKVVRLLDEEAADEDDICVLKTKFRGEANLELKRKLDNLDRTDCFPINGRGGIRFSSVFGIHSGEDRPGPAGGV